MTPFLRSWAAYVAAGWSPVPIRTVETTLPDGRVLEIGTPAHGFTGESGAFVTAETRFSLDPDEFGDVALRLPENVVGIDVDHYVRGGKSKLGGVQLADLESRWGALPDTWVSTARDLPSGIRLFRLPPGVTITSQAEANIRALGHEHVDVIRTGHRFARVWPHSKVIDGAATVYSWIGPDGTVWPDGEIPAVSDLPELPTGWVLGLITAPEGAAAGDRVRADAAQNYVAGDDGRAIATGRSFTPDQAHDYLYSNPGFLGALGRTPQGGGFNDALLKAAGDLHKFVPDFYSPAQADDMLDAEIKAVWHADRSHQDQLTINSARKRATERFVRAWDTSALPHRATPGSSTFTPPVAGAVEAVPDGTSVVVPGGVLDYDDCEGGDCDEGLTGRLCNEVGRVEGELLDEVFSDEQFPLFGHARHFARARGVSPIAVLGTELLRISCAIPPYVVLPALVGGKGSLNQFLCLVGGTGASKGASTRAAVDAVEVEFEHTANGVHQGFGGVYHMKIGSGQGFAGEYCYRRKADGKTGDPGELIRERDSVLFTCNEIADLVAKSSGASTLLSTLCELWVAEDIGSAYIDKSRRLPMAGHSYRAGFILHAQPKLMGPLIDDEAVVAGGTPGRFVYLPVRDAFRPDVRPEEPQPVTWSPPRPIKDGTGQIVLPVCEAAKRAVYRHQRLTEQGKVSELEAHRLFKRLKLAAAIDASRDVYGVTCTAWKHAGAILKVSDQTVADALAELRQGKSRKAKASREIQVETAKAIKAGEVEVVADKADEIEEKRVQREIARALEMVAASPIGLSERELLNGVSGERRALVKAAVARLLATGQLATAEVEFESGKGRPGIKTVLRRPAAA